MYSYEYTWTCCDLCEIIREVGKLKVGCRSIIGIEERRILSIAILFKQKYILVPIVHRTYMAVVRRGVIALLIHQSNNGS